MPPIFIRDPDSDDNSIYGYDVDPHISIAYTVLFSITGAAHVTQSFYYRLWWLAPTMGLCALLELLGWVGRYISSFNGANLSPFLMQICCTILAPSFMAAGLFFILGGITNRVGPQYVSLRPKTFSLVFIACDFASLVVQAVGGATASVTSQQGKNPDGGAKIMVGGIIFHMFAVTLYAITAIEFTVRWLLDKPVQRKAKIGQDAPRAPIPMNIKLQSFGMVITTVLLYIRSIYRTIELLDGWRGSIILNQNLLNYLDALPIVLALLTLNILNPGRLLFKARRRDEARDDATVVGTLEKVGHSLPSP